MIYDARLIVNIPSPTARARRFRPASDIHHPLRASRIVDDIIQTAIITVSYDIVS